jgi:NitT/TauT family transport system ATP-binding protein
MSHKIILNVEGVSQWFGKNRVLHDINLKIVQGQFVALVGPSGCGKSTLLRAILGTEPPKEGIVETDGEPVLGPNRNVGIVYQKYGLYRFLTVQDNVAFGPKLDQTEIYHRTLMPWHWWPLRKKQHEEAALMLEKLRLKDSGDKYPSELSGGMQQRVAIAQALVMKPKLLLLDEPFGALDESTREELQLMLLRLYQENLVAIKAGKEPPWTVIIITHELNEAFYVSDRVIGLSRNWFEHGSVDPESVVGRKCGEQFGATKVWDKAAPTFHPDEPKDFSRFAPMRDELKNSVLSGSIKVERNAHVSFWDDLANGVGTGVAFTKGPNDE